MKVRSESLTWVAGAGTLALITFGLWIYTGQYWLLGGFVFFAALSGYFVYFFRDPDRTPEFSSCHNTVEPERCWLAPADGIVTGLERENDGRLRLVIFLTIFNVHVNRMPVSGTIRGIEYREGRFLPAFADNLKERNERNRIVCRDSHSRSFELWQVAGLLARRIHFWGDVDVFLKQGERFGMISLGSRTDLILPEDVRSTVSLKDRVLAGRTIVGRG